MFDKFGLLDEIFSPGFGEDTDFCLKVENAGYKVVQVASDQAHMVPIDGLSTMVGGFPIFHRGHKTFKFVEEGDRVIIRNTKILADRYGTEEQGVAKPVVYNVFSFNNELDILEMRFLELYDVVDRFVISEGNKTFGGKPKPYHFKDNLKRFEKWLPKVTHIMVDDWPNPNDPWSMEHYQRDCLMRGLKHCKDNDVIVITDADELPTAEAIRNYRPENGVQCLEMNMWYYDMTTKHEHTWKQPKIAPYSELKKHSFWQIIYAQLHGIPNSVIPNAGRHLCYFGGVESIIKKIEDGAHQELNTDEIKNPERIRRAIEKGIDLFGRSTESFVKVGATTKYNLGSGDDYRDGFVNVDLYAERADIRADLSKDWTFAPDNSADFVFASHIIEHLPDKIHTVNELWRILKIGARVELVFPSTDGRGWAQDFTHCSFWNANFVVYISSELNASLTKATWAAGFRGDFKVVSVEEKEEPFKIVITKIILEKIPRNKT